MTESIRVDAGIVRIRINEDDDRVLEFNPTDILFVRKFEELSRKMADKKNVFDEKTKDLDFSEVPLPDDLDKIRAEDAENLEIPDEFRESLDLLEELVDWILDELDDLFDTDIRTVVFDGYRSFDMINQFMDGIAPYLEQSRAKRVGKYLEKSKKGPRAEKSG